MALDNNDSLFCRASSLLLGESESRRVCNGVGNRFGRAANDIFFVTAANCENGYARAAVLNFFQLIFGSYFQSTTNEEEKNGAVELWRRHRGLH